MQSCKCHQTPPTPLTTFLMSLMILNDAVCLPWKVLEESKCLMRSILLSVLEEVNDKECQMLKQLWCSTKGLEALFSYMHNKPCEK